MTRALVLLLLSLSLLLSTGARSADVTSVWIGPTGEWTDGSLWSTNPVFPENGALTYQATIDAPAPGGFNVQLSRDLTVDSLFLRNATLSNSGTLQLTTGLTLGSFGRISGGTVIASGASLLSGSSLQLPDFVNQGTTTWESGNLALGSSGSIVNATSALFTISGSADRTLTSPFPTPFQNDGTLVHSSTGTTSIQSSFANAGLVRVQAGSLQLGGGGTSAGDYEISSGATLGFRGSVLDTSQITGAGNLSLGNTSLEGTFDLTGTTTVTGQAEVLSTGNRTRRLVLGGSTVSRLYVGGSIDVAEDFLWRGGTLTGPGTLAVNGPIVLAEEGERMLDGFQLSTVDGLAWRGGPLSLVNGAVLTNAVSSTFEVDTTAGVLNASGAPGDALIRNEGSLVKLGDGIATLQIPVESSGAIRVDAGELWLNGPFTTSAAIAISDGATLQLGSSSELLATSSVTGLGTLRVSGSGTHDLRGTFTPGAFDARESTTVHFLDPLALYEGGFSTSGNASVSFDAAPVELRNVTALGGFLTVPGGSSLGGDFDWQFGTLTSDGAVDLVGTTRVNTSRVVGADLRNRGSLELTVNTLELEEEATLLNTAVASLRFNGQQNILRGASGSTFLNQGVVIDENDSALGSSSASVQLPFVNEGLVEIRGDGIDGSFKSTMDFTDFRQTAGTLFLNGGDIITFTGAPLRVDGGSVIGNGNLFVDVESRGRIAPGNAAGEAARLHFGSDLTLFDGSTLAFEIGGTEAGVDFDVIDARDIFLDGALSVTVIDGFEATISSDDEFEVAIASRNLLGVLDDVVSGARLLTSDGLGSFAAFYGASSPFDPDRLVLTDFQAVPEPTAAVLVLLAALGLIGRRSRGR